MIKILTTICFLLPFYVFGQTISGKVINEKNMPLEGAVVFWQGDTIKTFSNRDGAFEIEIYKNKNNKLISSLSGYISDTIIISNQKYVIFKLKQENTLDEVIVNNSRYGVIISDINSIKTESITQTELKKAACCDLAGCFDTQISVQPQTTNVITNSKELRILGLSGVYNQVLVDGFPMIQGLSFTYGISGIPGTLVDNIYISKGANSVLQGFESISGQINVETKDPDKTDKLLLNAYINNFEEKHFNANYVFKKEKWSNLLAVHIVQPANKIDRDNDTFLDLPQLTRYMIFNKWKYGNEKNWGWSTKIGLRFLNEQRVGGQINYNSKTDQGSNLIYGQTVNINQPEMWAKTVYKFNDENKITFFTSSFIQDQKSFFGTVQYIANQTNFYGNLQYELNYLQKHSIKMGLSYRYLKIDENISFTDNTLQRTFAGNYNRMEHISGLFIENSMAFLNNKLTWIAGLRGDNHSQFGTTLTPRTLIKFDFTPKTVVRASIGTGWRTANLFSENIGLLVSSRDIIFSEQLRPERATNFGLNLTQKFESSNLSGFFSADYYRTNFQNQIFPDYDSDPIKAIIQNFDGTSVGNGFQTELYLKIWKRFEFKIGYNFLDVYREVNGKKQILPFNATHKVLTTYGYKPLSNKFHFDVNIHWYGEQRLPDTKTNPVAFQRPDFSQAFTLVNAQFTYVFKNFEVYTGCENIFNFRQNQPIISWQNPFGQYFDTSSVWGPTRGRETYIGMRFTILNAKPKI